MKVLLGITGSVAAILGNKLIEAFEGDEVKVVPTKAAQHFSDFGSMAITDADEWLWNEMGDPILHIDLRDWMDVLVIAPLSANSLGKMANGICDNLLMSIWLAHGNKPVVVAPAMNTQMWQHPAVQKNISTIKTMGVHIVSPVKKKLACGETGAGAMNSVSQIVVETRTIWELETE